MVEIVDGGMTVEKGQDQETAISIRTPDTGIELEEYT